MSQKFNFPADQGIYSSSDWAPVKFFMRKDYSAWQVKGQVRTNYLDKPNVLIADFEFEPLVYGAVTIGVKPPFQATIIIPRLSGQNTKGIAGTDRTPYVYDIFLTQGSKRVLVVYGSISCKNEVTELTNV
jgi:hypothetical protein